MSVSAPRSAREGEGGDRSCGRQRCKQGLKVGRTPRSCPRPMVLKDSGVGRREVENLGVGIRDRCWGDPFPLFPAAQRREWSVVFLSWTWTWGGEDRNCLPD